MLVLLLLILQYRLWIGEGSLAEVSALRHRVDEQRTENIRLMERNRTLDAEVKDLKSGLDAIEERARNELGMTKEDEVFYQVIDE